MGGLASRSVERVPMDDRIPSVPARAFRGAGKVLKSLLPICAVVLLVNARAQTVPTGFSNALVMAGWEQAVGFTFDASVALDLAAQSVSQPVRRCRGGDRQGGERCRQHGEQPTAMGRPGQPVLVALGHGFG